MKHIILAALLILSATSAMAIDITDDTPARPITIGKPEGDLGRVVISKEVLPMAKCKELLEANIESLKENSVAIMCVPADMTEPGFVKGEAPFIDLTE
ncbi:hypothetical protein [Rhizobium leguminosarum]|uniref:hypothetical protein n=1 Tax=Rhizobium leguminosarum TaxID=384 RepID=UPI00103CECDC|nr:hypothetical protein [Rhizobium leguminosarum]TCA10321.1 hypothetical protein E0H57_05740 [Rhizobium leguminosarum bv. viciae]